MPSVRGIFVLNTIRFVREHFGEDAHDKVLASLQPEHRTPFVGPLREASWESLESVVAYMESAKRIFAPDDAGFYRRLGYFSGQQERNKGGFQPLVAEPSTASRMAMVLWRSFYDTGRVEVTVRSAKEGFVRILEFPAFRPHCERICGAWEGLLTTPGSRAHVEETACVANGDPCCEMHVVWD